MRTFGISPSVRQPKFPLYLSGLGASAAQTAVSLTAAAVPVAASAAVSTGLIPGSVAGPIGAAVGALLGLVAGLLAAHAQRAADAKNENAAADSASQTFDQVIQQVVAAYNNGSASVSECVQALQQMQQTMLTTLQSKVGPPGTAWTKTPPSPGAGIACNTSCTVGCCLYYNDLVPGIIMLTQALQALGTPLTSAQVGVCAQGCANGQGMPLPASVTGTNGIATSFTVTMPAISTSKYSDYSRPAYQVTLTMPATSSVTSALTSLVGGSTSTSGEGSSLLPLLAIGLLAYLIV